MDFAHSIIQWYGLNKRDLPWRETKDPYFIWLSEVLLQQTRVAQGMPYYFAFSVAFPTVFDLAAASEQEVLKLWQGLGYYSRARNLHQTAKEIVSEYDGKFPNNFRELLELKGVGAYTAAAIASFSFDEAVPVVDGNVFRVLARVFDLETDIQSTLAKREFTELAGTLMPKDKAAVFNQAVMEFGALQCVPKNPNCSVCVFSGICLGKQKGKVDKLPVKTKKQVVRTRYFNYLVYLDQAGQTIIKKREQKGIWRNLYEFPLFESNALLDGEQLIRLIDEQRFVDNEVVALSDTNPPLITHKLTHQNLQIKFWEIKVSGNLKGGLTFDDISAFPVPIVLHNFIESQRR